MKNFTPGNWTYKKQTHGYAVYEPTSDNVICLIGYEDSEAEPNAKLISVAPELLYALIDICETVNTIIRINQDCVSIDCSAYVPAVLVESINIGINAIKKATE